MDHETNKQEPSGTEGGKVKAGDKVWVEARIENVRGERVQIMLGSDRTLWLSASDCRPVEPLNCSEIPNSSSEPIKVGDAVVIVERSHKWRGVRGRIVSVSESNEYPLEFISDCGKRLGYFRTSSMRKKNNADPVAPSPCIDGIKVGDAVRFVLPGHDRHKAEGIIFSIVKGPNREYHFQSNCGQFHRYCTAEELERIIKRYRTPTLADLANGPIACEYRDSDEEHWRRGFLVHVLNGAIPFLCVNEQQELSGQWDQCRIEVGE
jgi:hypothetical protein